MIDAVLGYHMNPATCGVAKFNARLARELGVPLGHVHDDAAAFSHPLVSIKPSEMPYPADVHWKSYDLFLHDDSLTTQALIVQLADRVFAATRVIADQLRPSRTDVVEAWCPSTIEGNPTRGTINVLTFGMAHKIQVEKYGKLKTLLDATDEDYTVSVSTAIHEGSPWDETAQVGDELRHTFGHRLRVLGYLGDDALARELSVCTAVALFFDPALRANNTTAWAVIDAQKPLITNADEHSPDRIGYIRIDDMNVWPDFSMDIWEPAERHAREREAFNWTALLRRMQAVSCVK